MIRASWLFKLVLEWKKAHPKVRVPEQFVERYSRDLFVTPGDPVEDQATIDLLKATKLKFSQKGFEASFNE